MVLVFCTRELLLVVNVYAELITGVHVGQVDKNLDSLPMAVSFVGDEVARFLHRHNLAVQ